MQKVQIPNAFPNRLLYNSYSSSKPKTSMRGFVERLQWSFSRKPLSEYLRRQIRVATCLTAIPLIQLCPGSWHRTDVSTSAAEWSFAVRILTPSEFQALTISGLSTSLSLSSFSCSLVTSKLSLSPHFQIVMSPSTTLQAQWNSSALKQLNQIAKDHPAEFIQGVTMAERTKYQESNVSGAIKELRTKVHSSLLVANKDGPPATMDNHPHAFIWYVAYHLLGDMTDRDRREVESHHYKEVSRIIATEWLREVTDAGKSWSFSQIRLPADFHSDHAHLHSSSGNNARRHHSVCQIRGDQDGDQNLGL